MGEGATTLCPSGCGEGLRATLGGAIRNACVEAVRCIITGEAPQATAPGGAAAVTVVARRAAGVTARVAPAAIDQGAGARTPAAPAAADLATAAPCIGGAVVMELPVVRHGICGCGEVAPVVRHGG
mmetsp:Transcript_99315/g.212793  ORF Transcript_99315/g.212793 Transcript_99315/m.212793 type:complete len:126 (-) Transcript_99315:487-864(-)